MEKFLFWQKWLLVVGIVLVLFGIIMALFSGTTLFALFDGQINPVFWNAAEISGEIQQFQHWIYGVLGATVAGWGILITFIAYYPFKAQERWSWNCVFWGILVWFIVDTTISLYHSVYFNAIFNTVLLVLIVLPLGFTRRCFFQ